MRRIAWDATLSIQPDNGRYIRHPAACVEILAHGRVDPRKAATHETLAQASFAGQILALQRMLVL